MRAERTDIDVLYIGDQGVPGYGTFSRSTLTSRLNNVFRTFLKHGVTDVVVACNAASTVVEDVHVPGVTGHGIIRPTLAALEVVSPGKIGLIGGRRTVRSGVYRRPLQAKGWTVRQRVAQPLSRRIEDGEAETPDTHRLLAEILAPLASVDRLVLACTHYVVLEPRVREILPKAEIVDPATEAWATFKHVLPPQCSGSGKARFLTTGSAEAMERQARVAFGVEAEVEEVVI